MTPASAGGAFAYAFTPYCGAPVGPDAVLQRWNLDPILLTALLLTLVAYAACSGLRLVDRGRVAAWRQGCFYAGWTIGALAVVSPLCPLSVSLFSARVAQHMLLASIVAPLVALGRPGALLAAGIARLTGRPAGTTGARLKSQPLTAAAVFAIALWVWHAPGPYTATFESDAVYWLMHLTLFGAALWLWSALLDTPGERLGSFVAASALTTVQMGLLGAIITFAARPLYPPHEFTTFAWGLTPLEDQQLGGVVMWVPAGIILVVSMTVAFVQALARAEMRALGRSVV